MIKEDIIKKYKVTIGIECHVQLKTKTKLFSGSINDSTSSLVNQLANHIDFGMPGALPVTNIEAVELAIRAGYALNTKAQKFSKFDRKHYFYPDLPMGYQITQYEFPILKGGYIDIVSELNQLRRIDITRAHLEADAGKSIHPSGSDYSLVDLNRSGAPLLEIVSEPQMHTAIEARNYCFELYLAMKLAQVSDANLFFGNMRFDVNVSVSKTDQLGTRTETKNLNSFRSVEKSIEFEVIRQIEILEKGGTIRQETRGWNDAKQAGFTQRIKENADDYRYMPDPDIPPVIIDDKLLTEIEASMPILPIEWRRKLANLNLDVEQTNLLLGAQADYLTEPLGLLNSVIDDEKRAKMYANWLINIELPLLQKNNDADNNNSMVIDYEKRQHIFNHVYQLKVDQKINSTKLNLLIEALFNLSEKIDNIESWAQKEGFLQNSDENILDEIVDRVIRDNPKVVQDILDGQAKAVGFLVGQIMKETKGQANPQIINRLINEKIKP